MSRLLLLLLAATIGCSAPLTVSREPSAATAEPAPGTTEPCRSEDDVRATVERFVAAFNSGEGSAVRPTVSRYAEWFSITLPPGHESVYGQDDIIVHLRRRQGAGDRFGATSIRVNGLVGWDGSAHFEVASMDLIRGGTTIHLRGKGALQCRGRGEGVVVLSLGAA